MVLIAFVLELVPHFHPIGSVAASIPASSIGLPSIMSQSICGGLLPFYVDENDPARDSILLVDSSTEHAQTKSRLTFGSAISAPGRVELMRQVCSSRFASVHSRIAMAKSMGAIMSKSSQHKHVSYRIA